MRMRFALRNHYEPVPSEACSLHASLVGYTAASAQKHAAFRVALDEAT
jgi:hypothetical protein